MSSSNKRELEARAKIVRHFISCIFVLLVVSIIALTTKACFITDKEHSEEMKRLELIEKGCIEE